VVLKNIKIISQLILQDRLDGKLTGPMDVHRIVMENQPAGGLTIPEWSELTEFILSIEKADNIPAAKSIAEQHKLVLKY
jgi:hypothetical protein